MAAGGSEKGKGYVYALLGAVAGGSIPALSKLLLADNGPVPIAAYGVFISGLFLLINKPRSFPGRGGTPYVLSVGLLGAFAAQLLFTVGLTETTAVNASLLTNGEVLFTTMIAFFIFGERLGRGQASRGVMILVGLLIVSTNLDLSSVRFLQGLQGNLLILGATLCWGVENNLLAVATRRFDPAGMSKLRNLIGGAALLLLVFVGGYQYQFAPYDMAVLTLLGLAMAAATFLFLAAIKRLGAIRMLLVWATATIWGTVFALVILGEQITVVQILGGLFILFGVYLFRRSEPSEGLPRASSSGQTLI